MMHRIIPMLPKWSSSVVLSRAVSSASKVATEVKSTSPQDPNSSEQQSTSQDTTEKTPATIRPKPKLVAQVFANLLDNAPKEAVVKKSSPENIEKKIKEAKDVNTLLELASTKKLSRSSALAILAILGDWTGEKKVKLSDFEHDLRFLSMCRTLSQDFKINMGLGDLATVLGVTGDDNAAKLINSASLNQMVQIIEKLSAKKKRSAPLLRSLAFNMSRSEDKLNIKQCADVLYAMASLSFHDEVLLVKVCGDAVSDISEDTRSSVVGSIARSVGIIRCRDTVLLDKMAVWLERNLENARPQDAVAVLMSLASVAYLPSNSDGLFKVLVPLLRPPDMTTAGLYLDAVWSLLLLDKHTPQQIAMVLSSGFVDKLRKEDGSKLSHSTLLKLLNANAAAQYLIPNYKGPRLPKELSSEVLLTRSKDKTTLVNSVMDTLSNLLPGDNFLRRDVDSTAGFIIDGECLLDKKCTPLPLTKPAPADACRVAIMILAYHDTCVGARFHANGLHTFISRVLQARGYSLLSVLHSEFSPSSKLVNRVQYLEQKLKSLVTR